MVEIIIGENEKKQRLDRFIKKYLKNLPLSGVYKLIRNDIKVNGRRKKENYVLEIDDVLSLYISEEELNRLTAKINQNSESIVDFKSHMQKKINFEIVYEDDNILAVGKPFGMLTHGDMKEKKKTLDNQVKGYLIDSGVYSPRKEKTFSPAPINRLDRNTTGIILFGKNSESLREMNAMWDNVNKYYLTVVVGKIDSEMLIKGRLKKDEKTNRVFVEIERPFETESKAGKYIQTFIKPLAVSKNNEYTLLEIRLDTGRSHQIRATLAEIGHPILGDGKYISDDERYMKAKKLQKKLGISTQMLHAYRIEFNIKDGSLAYLDGKKITQKPPRRFIDCLRKIDEKFLIEI